MRRFSLLGVLITAILITGCPGGRPKPREVEINTDKKLARHDPEDHGKHKGKKGDPPITRISYPEDAVTASLPKSTKEENYEAVLLEAVDFLADRKYADALASLKKAQAINDTGAVQREITKVEALIAQEEGAQKAVQDVKSVLDDGNADEAAKLANAALAQYGGGDNGDALTRLKQQADAVVSAETDDVATRKVRLRAEADAAIKENNLRAAVVALEQVLALGENLQIQRQLEDVRGRLQIYDQNRDLAITLRRDPARLEESLTVLRKAQGAWDTLQIQQEIDQCNLIIQRRRDRLSVADFEVRGDVGVPAAGRAIAEELLGHFKPRYDLVERGQINRVLAELKLDSDDLVEGNSGQEVARLAKVRFLVVGSITPLAGITAQARLVEVRTGLIVQTARVSAPDVETLLPKLRQLALMLQMNDADKAAYEAKLASVVEVIKPIEAPAAIDTAPIDPLPPPPSATAPPPPPIITYTPRPPAPIVIEDVRPVFVAPVVIVEQPPPPPLAVVIQNRNPVLGRRLFALSLQLGDDCYRRGHYREAQRHFSLALSIGGPRRELSLRIDRCRSYTPPPVYTPAPVVVQPAVVIGPTPIVVTPPPMVVVARPRVAVFGFALNCQPGLVPPAATDVIADQFAAYCRGSYEVIDRGEVSWYMGRLGITMREVLGDPVARRSLANALNARFFVYGQVVETASFNVETSLVDPESGNRVGAGKIHVKDLNEMKLRLGELARQMGAKPEEQKKLVAQSAAGEQTVQSARKLLQANQPDKAVETIRAGLKTTPNNVALKSLLAQAEQKQRLAKFETDRRAEAARQAALLAAAQKRQRELAQEAATAKIRAEAEAKKRTDVAQKQQQTQRERAAASLRTQAGAAKARGDHNLAAQLLQSALNLKSDPAVARELAQERLAVQNAKEEREKAEQQKRLAALDAQRKSALTRIAKEKNDRLQAEKARKADLEKLDRARHDEMLKTAGAALAKNDLPHALAAAESARRYHASEESNKLLQQIRYKVDLAEAAKKGAQEKARIEKERKDREAAELKLKRDRETYLAAMKKGEQALVAKKYDEAYTHYLSASKLFRTEPALTALKTAEDLRSRERAAIEADKKAKQEAANRTRRMKDLIDQGEKFMTARQYAKARDSFREANKIAPNNVDAVAGLSRAEREYNAEMLRNQRAQEAKLRQASVAKALAAGKASLAKKQYAAARTSFEEVLKLDPTNTEAQKLRNEVLVKLDPKLKEIEENYQLALGAGRSAMKAMNYDGAYKAFTEALRIKPGDPTAVRERNEAMHLAKEAPYLRAMQKGRALMSGKQYAEAMTNFDLALKAKPGDGEAIKLKKEAEALLKKTTPSTDPNKIEYQKLIVQARAEVKAGRYDQGIGLFDRALKLFPRDKIAGDERNEAITLRNNAAYATAIRQGKLDMTLKKYKEAITSFDNALKVKPGDSEALKWKKEADDLLKKSMTPPVDPKRVQFNRLLEQARAEVKARRYAEGIDKFDDALKLFPGDKAAVDERNAAIKLRNETAYTLWMQRGKGEITAKKYKEAMTSFDNALKLKPGDGEAIKWKKEADDLLKKSMTPPVDPKRVQFNKLLDQARAEVKARRYAEGIDKFDDALKLFPGDKAAVDERNAAIKLRNETAYTLWIQKAKTDLAAKKYNDAISAYDQALKLKPGDPEATAGKRAAIAAASKPTTPPVNPKDKQREEDYQLALGAGRTAMKTKNYAGAINAYNEALRLKPGDKVATSERAEAVKLRAEAAYPIWLQKGNAAMAAKKYAEAVTAYDEALKLKPGDPAAIKGKKEATAAMKIPPKGSGSTQPPAPGGTDYATAMRNAQAMEQQRKFAEARGAYQIALSRVVGDSATDPKIRAARFACWMGIGRCEHGQRDYADAIKAYEVALKLYPDNATAKDALARAKARKP